MANDGTWLEYEWRLDGAEALFGVELALYRDAPDAASPLLCYFCCGTADDTPLTESDLRRIGALASKCVKQTGKPAAGFVQTGGMRQYYFYLPSKAEYEKLKEIAAREKKYVCRVGGKREDDWSTYFKLLYPDAAKYQTVRNREMIRKMSDCGDAVTSPRRLNLHLFFRTELLRLQFEETARQAGYAIGDSEDRSESELPHGVALHRISTLQKKDVDAVTIRAIRLAEKFGGRLVYWDCAIVPRSVSKR